MKLEFIHCADLHLGCNTERIEERYADFFASFEDVIEYTYKHKIKYLLISGDFFHLKVINAKTLNNTIELLKKAQKYNISIFVIEGNHDKAYYVDEESWLMFLSNQGLIVLLSSDIKEGGIILNKYKNGEGGIFEVEEGIFVGLSYLGATTEKYLQNFKNKLPKSKKPIVLMLHAAVDRLVAQDMADVKKDVLLNYKDKVNYIALGHIHNKYEYDNFLFNPGSLENIRIKDGEFPENKGFYHVKIEDGITRAKHIESKKRKVHIKRFDVSKYLNPMDFVNDITEAALDFEEKSSAVIQLWGKVDYNALTFDTKLIADNLKTKYNLLSISIVNSVNIINYAAEGKTLDVDIASLVEDALINSIKYHYPEEKEKSLLASQMINLARNITDGMDYADIVYRLDEEGEEQ